tara:strand:+ start:1695 stop:1847 length:153 start_codon:yes stop_codon:yes gene_type:complete
MYSAIQHEEFDKHWWVTDEQGVKHLVAGAETEEKAIEIWKEAQSPNKGLE